MTAEQIEINKAKDRKYYEIKCRKERKRRKLLKRQCGGNVNKENIGKNHQKSIGKKTLSITVSNTTSDLDEETAGTSSVRR